MESGPIKRTVTLPPKKSYKKTRASPKRIPLGLQRYIDSRGTPRGTYEIVRTVTGSIEYNNTGMAIGLANYSAGTIVFTPNYIQLISSPTGNTITWNVVNASEISALWDKIKLDKVDVMITSSVIGTANSGTQQPLFNFAFDDNDSVTSADQISQMDCRTWSPGDNNHPFRMTVKPAYTQLIYYTAIASAYQPMRGYISSGTDVPHYGLKIGMPLLGASGKILLTFKMYFKCKELK